MYSSSGIVSPNQPFFIDAPEAGLLVDLFMVTSPHNIDHLEDAFSLATDLGVHELSFMRSWPWAAGHRMRMRCSHQPTSSAWSAFTKRRTGPQAPGSRLCPISSARRCSDALPGEGGSTWTEPARPCHALTCRSQLGISKKRV